MERNDIVDKLATIGLDREEADLYLRLLELGPTKVSTLTAYVDTSRSSLYRHLDDLCERGFASKSLGQPTVYEARAPAEVFENRGRALEREQSRLEEIEEELSEPLSSLQGTVIDDQEPHWHRLEGTSRIYEVLETLLDEATDSIVATSNHPTCFSTEIPIIDRAWTAVGDRVRDGVETRVLLDFSHGSLDALDGLLPLDRVAVRHFETDRVLHMIVIDEEEVVVWARVEDPRRGRGPEPVALWTSAPTLVAGQLELAERLWEDSDPLQPTEVLQTNQDGSAATE